MWRSTSRYSKRVQNSSRSLRARIYPCRNRRTVTAALAAEVTVGLRATFLRLDKRLEFRAAGEDAFVVRLVERNDPAGAEAVAGGFAGGGSHGVQAGVVAEQSDGRVGHGFDVADGEGQAVGWTSLRAGPVVDQLRDAADAGGDGGH